MIRDFFFTLGSYNDVLMKAISGSAPREQLGSHDVKSSYTMSDEKPLHESAIFVTSFGIFAVGGRSLDRMWYF